MFNKETDDTEILLFKNISRNLLLYGFGNFAYQIEYLSLDENFEDSSTESVNYFLFNLNNAIDKHGALFMYYYVKKPSFGKKKYDHEPINSEHLKAAINIVCDVFDVNEEEFLLKDKRDGKRIYASAALTSLLLDVLSYSRKDIIKHLKRSNVFISQRKKIIDDLDYKHRFDREITNKYLKCKVELINHILNGKEKTN
jgi:hypothetical protein